MLGNQMYDARNILRNNQFESLSWLYQNNKKYIKQLDIIVTENIINDIDFFIYNDFSFYR